MVQETWCKTSLTLIPSLIIVGIVPLLMWCFCCVVGAWGLRWRHHNCWTRPFPHSPPRSSQPIPPTPPQLYWLWSYYLHFFLPSKWTIHILFLFPSVLPDSPHTALPLQKETYSKIHQWGQAHWRAGPLHPAPCTWAGVCSISILTLWVWMHGKTMWKRCVLRQSWCSGITFRRQNWGFPVCVTLVHSVFGLVAWVEWLERNAC